MVRRATSFAAAIFGISAPEDFKLGEAKLEVIEAAAEDRRNAVFIAETGQVRLPPDTAFYFDVWVEPKQEPETSQPVADEKPGPPAPPNRRGYAQDDEPLVNEMPREGTARNAHDAAQQVASLAKGKNTKLER
ncbi:MAG: hypothetical protein J2P47_00930 [Acetobacteraceae bacterium]|nr:hypothetical protein [Acetobacteraceae bacterium]